MKLCPKCSEENFDNARHCNSCGESMSVDPESFGKYLARDGYRYKDYKTYVKQNPRSIEASYMMFKSIFVVLIGIIMLIPAFMGVQFIQGVPYEFFRDTVFPWASGIFLVVFGIFSAFNKGSRFCGFFLTFSLCILCIYLFYIIDSAILIIPCVGIALVSIARFGMRAAVGKSYADIIKQGNENQLKNMNVIEEREMINNFNPSKRKR